MPIDSKSQKRFGQRIPNHKTISALSDSDGYEPSLFRREIFLDYDQWQNIGEDKLPWYEYNHSSTNRTEVAAIQRLIIPCIREIIVSGLTSRQREVITMYFLNGRSQVFIARKLGISQPTVKRYDFYSNLYRQYSADLLKLYVYVRKLITNEKVRLYLEINFPEIYAQFENIIFEVNGISA